MQTDGAYLVAFGKAAEMEAQHCAATIPHGLSVKIARGDDGALNKQSSRQAKINLLDAPFDRVLYLDADTRIYGDISAAWDALSAGWDIAITHSDNQGHGAFWHVKEAEREITLAEIEYLPVQWQCGVMFVARNERTAALMSAWLEEWQRWQDEDQAAFVRALHRAPVRIWPLGRPWNGGAIIGHRFGACR